MIFIAPRPSASTTALSPTAPSFRDPSSPSAIWPFGGAAGAVNQMPGKPATCKPNSTPLLPIAVIILEPLMPLAPIIIHFDAAIQRFKNILGDWFKNARTSSLEIPPLLRLSISLTRNCVAAIVRP